MPSDSELCVVHYGIELAPDFSKNLVDATVSMDVKNFSPQPVQMIEFFLCTYSDAKEIEAEVSSVFILDKEKLPLLFEKVITDASRPSFLVSLPAPLAPGISCKVVFDYQIYGKYQQNCLPVRATEHDELYLLTDFQWLPVIKYQRQPQQFPNILKPSWNLTLVYPNGYTGVADGELVDIAGMDEKVIQKWRGFLGSWPEVVIGQFKKIQAHQDSMTAEIYWPGHLDLEQEARAVSDDILKMHQFYSELYGAIPTNIFRIIVTSTPGGAHGLLMGAVLNTGSLSDLKTLSHEIAHTWWGGLLSSYGEGSKFLREAVANFSSALALQHLRGDEFAKNAWRAYKIRTFFNYYLALDQVLPRCPLIIQDGFDPRMVTAFNYTKGALVINLLRNELGDALFFRCLRVFTREYFDQNVNIHDFINTFNAESGEDLMPLFKDLLWGTGYPSYALIDFNCKPDFTGYTTTVRVNNDGDLASSCSLLLQLPEETKTVAFKAPARAEAELLYQTEQPVSQVIIDPDLTDFNYAPGEAVRFWKLFDNEYLGMTNWYWYNKSYSFYLTGDYHQAITVISDYLNLVKNSKNWSDLRVRASEDLLASIYLFCRAHYYLAAQDSLNASLDIKAVMPSLFSILAQSQSSRILVNTGFVNAKEPEKDLLDILGRLTGRSFILPATDDQARSATVEEWKKWWQEKGMHKPLNLCALCANIRQ